MVDKFRWWLFKKLSWVAYFLCPEPHRSNLGVLWNEGMKHANNVTMVPEEWRK